MLAIRSCLTGLMLAGFFSTTGHNAAASVSAEAITGRPFGVARVTIDLKEPLQPLRDLPLMRVTEKNGRVLYPVYSSDATLLLALHRKDVKQLDAMFVFHGREPLELTVTIRQGETYRFTVESEDNESRHASLKEKWWHRTTQSLQGESGYGEPADVMNGYLASMLSRRLFKETPNLPRYGWREFDGIGYLVSFLTGTDSICAAMQTDRFLWGTERTEPADQLLPKGVTIPSVPVPDIPDGVVIEPIAMHVPEDCFYIRCGSFSNFLWLKSRIQTWGSQFRNMALRQPVDYGIQEKLERQLVLKETAVARLFGDRLVSDVAIIGADTLLRDGAALGVIFQTKDTSAVLKAHIDQLREAARENNPAIVQRFIEIAGRDVSLLSTEDNTVRSFHVVDGDFQIITNSRVLAGDFIRAGRGEKSLGKLDEFRHARRLMPASEKQTAFVYLPDPFFRRLVSPQCRVEMTRRMQAMTEIETVQYAKLAAKAEGRPHQTIGELIDGGFLPKDFRTRPDGSRTQLVDNRPIDSLRGEHSAFLPIPDVDIEAITKSEAQAYGRFKTEYRRMWTRVDPVAIGIERTIPTPQRERVVFDFHITPYVKSQFGFLSAFLAARSKQRMTRAEGDLIGAEAVIYGLEGDIEDPDQRTRHARFFAATGDPEFRLTFTDGHIQELWPDTEPFYLGAIPADAFPKGGQSEPDKDGYLEFKSNMFIPSSFRHARILNDMFLLTTSRERLDRVMPQLKLVDAERKAQIRFWLRDLNGTHLQKLADAHAWVELRRVSGRTATFLDRLTEQLSVNPKHATSLAGQLVHARLLDPLEGDFRLTGDDFPEWTSSAWTSRSMYDVIQIPIGFDFPLAHQIQSVEIEFSIDQTTIETRMELDIETAAFD